MNFDLQDYDLSANTPRRINIAGRQFLVVEAAGDLTIHAIRNQSRQGRITGAPQGIAIRSSLGSEGFHGLEVESDQAETIKLAIADDEVDLSSISSSVIISSPLEGGDVAVNDDDLQALLQNDEDLRLPLFTLEGATFGSVAGSNNSTLVAAGSNTNGVIVRAGYVNSSGNLAQFDIDGDNCFIVNNGGGYLIPSFFIPAGEQLRLEAGGSGSQVGCWYEVL